MLTPNDVRQATLTAARAKYRDKPTYPALHRHARSVVATYKIEQALASLDPEQRADVLEKVQATNSQKDSPTR
jgi:chorismate mutase